MGVRRCHGGILSAAIALILFFATGIVKQQGSALAGFTRDRQEPSFMSLNRAQERWGRAAAGRRRLAGPGSSPPSCRSRCGRCFPCQPVHVAIQPGRSVPMEYYPEAWRCKCGGKLFMP